MARARPTARRPASFSVQATFRAARVQARRLRSRRAWSAFSLGTDTAGSGRVPAAFNNLVGLKPTRGLLSTRGVVAGVPFARLRLHLRAHRRRCRDVLRCRERFRLPPIRSRGMPSGSTDRACPRDDQGRRFGVPRPSQLEFFGNNDGERLFGAMLRTDRAPGRRTWSRSILRHSSKRRGFSTTGPWVAERYVAIRDFFDREPERCLSGHPADHRRRDASRSLRTRSRPTIG